MASNTDSDVRSLLRKELSTRRITHPHASYSNTKSSLLSCTVCHLVIKSESLWEGHLRSANHRRNVQKLQEYDPSTATIGGRKRKANAVDEENRDGDETEAVAGEKKRKAGDPHDAQPEADEQKKIQSEQSQPLPPLRPSSSTVMSGFVAASTVDTLPPSETVHTAMPDGRSEQPTSALPATRQPEASSEASFALEQPSATTIDEDEWAAFEKEVVPLTKNAPAAQHSNATISAGPLSASEIAAQRASEERAAKGRSREEEAEAEREEEGRRMEEEFEVQEEMEGRVRRLRERLREIKAGERTEEDKMDETDGLSQQPEARSEEYLRRGNVIAIQGKLDEHGNEDQREDDDVDDDDDLDEFDRWGLR